jgi:DNA recombination protein RmuC
MIIRLPNHREIVVDSKVSLAAFLDSLELADDNDRQARLADHAAQVRQHVQRLAGKAYWDQFPHAPDFVVAFLPGETFFSAALSKDPDLIEYGVQNRVLLATPTTLIALLKAVAYGWRQERLAENAQAISDLGKELYDRLRVFASHMDGIRAGLERSVDSYNRAAGSFESRVLVSARRFKDLSAATGEDLPQAEPVDKQPRPLQAQDLALLASANAAD